MFKKLSNPIAVLIVIIISDLILRLNQITHLFYFLSDYDEGAYSLGGRFISDGALPYKDFLLVHPPLYDLTLALIYKTFGYNFFYGRYFSVFLSVVCVVLAYFILKKLFNPMAGLVAALSFTLFPGFYPLWYRVVQEPLGITLILFAIFFASDFIIGKGHHNLLIISGICLGFSAATKYTFIPAIVAFIIAIWLLCLQGRILRPRLIIASLFSKELWVLLAGTAAGFLSITGYFIIKTPNEFFSQTLLPQLTYRVGGGMHTALAKILRLPQALTQLFSFPNGLLTDTISTLSIATAAVVLVLLLIKVRQNHARTSQFLLTNLLVSLPLCAIFNPFGELRYFTSAFIVMLLVIASFTPLVNSKLASTQLSLKLLWGNTPIIILTILLVIFLGGTLALSQNYNYSGTGKITYEEIAYRDTIDYLKQLGANKIWASPIIPALDPELITTSKFDTFGYMFVIGTPVETLIKEQLADGVDYIVVDAFGSMLAITQPQMREFMQQVEQQGTLIKIITPENFTVLGERIYSFSNP